VFTCGNFFQDNPLGETCSSLKKIPTMNFFEAVEKQFRIIHECTKSKSEDAKKIHDEMLSMKRRSILL
jgi:hypothetical protein